MSDVTKYHGKRLKEYRLFGFKIFEIVDFYSSYEGEGEFIQEVIPNKEYFEKEFRNTKK